MFTDSPYGRFSVVSASSKCMLLSERAVPTSVFPGKFPAWTKSEACFFPSLPGYLRLRLTCRRLSIIPLLELFNYWFDCVLRARSK